MRQRFLVCLGLVLLGVACGPGSSSPGTDPVPALPDRDGDGIADEHEGCAQGRDSDGDGTPDCEDLDSDNDGIADAVEAGDEDTSTLPRDSDGDGTPDFLDADSDGNGMLDSQEGANDFDGDGVGDFADLDNDGDFIPDAIEIGMNPSVPNDFDGDGVPDLWDLDSDNDTILDQHERSDDPDVDGVPSYLDLDSDGDCILDADEAGDGILATPPLDSDNDGRFDFKDRDKDGDGLADSAEDENCNGVTDPGETSATRADSDGDGVTDLVEVSAGTNPTDAADNPQAHGDFVFVVPFEEPADPAEDDLDFSTNLRTVDVYVLVDRSGSMSGEIASIRSNIQSVANQVTCGAPSSDPNNCIEDIWWGVGSVGYSGTRGQSYTNHVSMQPDPTRITALPTTQPPGGCCYETLTLATWSVATGEGSAAVCSDLGSSYEGRATCEGSDAGSGGVGYPCFRPNALPLILLATDEAPISGSETYHCPDATTVIDAALGIGAKIMGILGSATAEGDLVRSDLETLAAGTGAVDASNGNAPLVVPGNDANAANAIATAIRLLANGVPLDISAEADDDPGDDIDAVSEFVGRLETHQIGTPECSAGLAEQDSNADGFPDLYVDVLPGTPVCWQLIPKQNTTVRPTAEPKLFRATINVYGDNVTLLDTRDVYFLVPPAPLDNPIE